MFFVSTFLQYIQIIADTSLFKPYFDFFSLFVKMLQGHFKLQQSFFNQFTIQISVFCILWNFLSFILFYSIDNMLCNYI